MAQENSFTSYWYAGLALDPIHVGTGGSRLGRVDNTIVRDPVTRIPKIPGSSLAGVTRAYVAMAKDKYPQCAGLGQPESDGTGGHCGKSDCPVCTVFGFAKGKDSSGGFAGLAAFSDMHVLLFPVATQKGPHWVTSPGAMRIAGINISIADENVVYHETESGYSLNLGWLMLPVKQYENQDKNEQDNNIWDKLKNKLAELDYIKGKVLLVSDKLFAHIVNSNLEIRTSVAIDPATGAAEDKALFTYEALPRGTVLLWEVTCRNPKHFKISGRDITAVESPETVRDIVAVAHSYLEHLGIGGMGSRGMGRLRVLNHQNPPGQKRKTRRIHDEYSDP